MFDLQRTAGNAAVTGWLASLTVQRGPSGKPAPPPPPKDFGWTDADQEKGYQWNARPQDVGKIHRIPLEGLHAGFQGKAAIPEMTKESAAGKAIVLVSSGATDALKAPHAKLEVVVFLHGFGEDPEERPFAGYRGLDVDKTAKKQPKSYVRTWQKGIDAKDVMPVRDVALDQAEQQLEASNKPLTILVLPQGGLTSQFDPEGREFNADAYVKEIIGRVVNNGDFLKTDKAGDKTPETIVGRVTMAGHSGGGIALAQMAREANRIDREKEDAATAGVPYKPGKSSAASSALTGDLVLFDAINNKDLAAFEEWAERRLNQQLGVLQGLTSPTDRRTWLATEAQKLRGYYSAQGKYVSRYRDFQKFIDKWFSENMGKLELLGDKADPLGVAACLHANFSVDNPVDVSHEELMRGNILKTLNALHPDPTTCPPLGDLGHQVKKPTAKPAKSEAKELAPVSKLADDIPIQRSKAGDLDAGYKSGGKAAVFSLLRHWGVDGPFAADEQLLSCLDRLFGPRTLSDKESDDRWLADEIIANGSEPHWPAAAFKERAQRARDHKWPAERGKIEGTFDAGKGKTPLEAHYFPGITDRRALVIGGVHGTEASGVEVVHDLLADMQKPDAAQPYFTVIVVPVIFPENLAAHSRTTSPTSEDPNRNFPKVGQSLGEARGKDNVAMDSQGRPIEPGNVILIDLIERFQPERIASVHGHQPPPPKPKPGKDMPGIFDDPRSGADKKKADDALALKMAKAAKDKGVRVPGNWIGSKDETSEYPPGAPKMSKGVSLGDYGPQATSARPAATVITVEVFGNEVSDEKSKAGAARKQELESLAAVIHEIFLGPPDG